MTTDPHQSRGWQFWIDRGGTFTDVVAQRPDGTLMVRKLLSVNPDRYTDAALQGIRICMGLAADEPIPADPIEAVKMGTTVATNALLERNGDRTVFAVTLGFRDVLRIAYQHRPDIFARQIVLPEMLYERVVEVSERYSAQGEELLPVDAEAARQALQVAFDAGIRSVAIAFVHGYRYPEHEKQVAELAEEIGFTQISASHRVSPLMKLVSRGDTTVVDAYLSPILDRYIDRVAAELGGTRLLFMQSNGGLADARFFRGKDSILSGPAGGVVGAVKTSAAAGIQNLIGFDMGGTSTDVSHYNGEYERVFETEVAGVRLRAPMMAIHTVAAGGGSILQFDGARYRVGPESAGAYPGPACYRHDGPLTVTDANVMVGKIQPQFFPHMFGPEGNLPLDAEVVQAKFTALAERIRTETGDTRSPVEVAQGFLAIAVETMANAIKKISIQRGYDLTDYTLCCFGGAGGQHACAIAAALGMGQVFIHPLAGVLSAYGMGLADLRVLRERAVEAVLVDELVPELAKAIAELSAAGRAELQQQGVAGTQVVTVPKAHLRYAGTDAPLLVDFGSAEEMRRQFEVLHQQRYGFVMAAKALVMESLSVEAIGQMPLPALEKSPQPRPAPLTAVATVPVYTAATWHETPVYRRQDLRAGDRLNGPAIVIEDTSTTVVEPGWLATLTERSHLLLQAVSIPAGVPIASSSSAQSTGNGSTPDPVLLEIFNHLFRAIAEEMGVVLQNTSYSVNIKERLDFSCALFDGEGQLVANAPHIPVHLGSMSESVQSLLRDRGVALKPGDVYVLNNPYNGGTHLPDITVITPVFDEAGREILFFVASRGHHADIGGISPGSMPPHSTSVTQEGILLDNVPLVVAGRFCEDDILARLTNGPYPARNPAQNLADLQAQVAANERGVQELRKMVRHFGLVKVQAYMRHVQNNAEASVRQAIAQLAATAEFSDLDRQPYRYPLDDGSHIQVQVTLDAARRSARIDFSGTSDQQLNNFNAPLAVTKAAVLYVFRTLVDDDIPLNAGCLKPLEIVIPEGCMLNPHYPAAVVAGNVETSQAVVNTLYAALGVMAAAQGTMNNFTFGSDRHQYYETLCGGSGAGPNFDGTDAVHTHMTNSRLTDPEVLEWRFPVLLEQFSIRAGSGGMGKHRGGNGVIRRMQFREPMTAAILSGHRCVPPPGLLGGEAGEVGRNWIERSDGTVEELASCAEVEVLPGDVFVVETPGGGGYGCSEIRLS